MRYCTVCKRSLAVCRCDGSVPLGSVEIDEAERKRHNPQLRANAADVPVGVSGDSHAKKDAPPSFTPFPIDPGVSAPDRHASQLVADVREEAKTWMHNVLFASNLAPNIEALCGLVERLLRGSRAVNGILRILTEKDQEAVETAAREYFVEEGAWTPPTPAKEMSLEELCDDLALAGPLGQEAALRLRAAEDARRSVARGSALLTETKTVLAAVAEVGILAGLLKPTAREDLSVENAVLIIQTIEQRWLEMRENLDLLPEKIEALQGTINRMKPVVDAALSWGVTFKGSPEEAAAECELIKVCGDYREGGAS